MEHIGYSETSAYKIQTPGNSTHVYLPMKMEHIGYSETSAYKIQTPGNSTHIYLPMKMEHIGYSETSAYKIQTPGNSTHIYLPMKMEQIGYSESSAYKIQTPGNYPEGSAQQWNQSDMRNIVWIYNPFVNIKLSYSARTRTVNMSTGYVHIRRTYQA